MERPVFITIFGITVELTHDQAIVLKTLGIVACIYLFWRLVIRPFWIPTIIAWIKQKWSNMMVRHSRKPSGAVTPQPGTKALNLSADIPAAGDVHAEEHADATRTPEVLAPVAAPINAWIERLLVIPSEFCPDTSTTFYAPVLYNAASASFMPHSRFKFYGTAECWKHVFHGTLPETIDSPEICRAIEFISTKSRPHLRILSTGYVLDRNYPVPALAAE